MSCRRIVGNLDCESGFAAHTNQPAGPLSRRVLWTIAGAATLLRAFARDGDRLWLPAPVTREVMADVPGLPRPILESGPLENLAPTDELLAWGETAAIAGMRRAQVIENSMPVPPKDLPWRLPAATPAAAAAANDRRFSLRLAAELGCMLPGARVVASPHELDTHLATVGTDRWVLKAPFSAAGRWRLIHSGGPVDNQTQRRIDRLFTRHGEMVFEPWMERTSDVGFAGAMTPAGIVEVSWHRLLVDDAGRFRGIELIAGHSEGPWLTTEERRSLDRMLKGVAAALQPICYTGPFGVDAWRYRLPGSDEAFHPLGEINGRLTFGWVARALLDRVREPLAIPVDSRVRLMFGQREVDPTGARIIPLLIPLAPGDPEARLEIFDPP